MEYLFAGHILQESAPAVILSAVAYLPAGHAKQPAPSMPNVPAGHNKHEALLVETLPSSVYVPAEQFLQRIPASAYLFATQRSQLSDGTSASFPAGQIWQPSEEKLENMFLGHSKQSVQLVVRTSPAGDNDVNSRVAAPAVLVTY